MARKKQVKNTKNNLKYDIIGVLLIFCSIYFYICLFSKDSGFLGKGTRAVLLGSFGIGSYIFPALVFIVGIAAVYMKNELKMNHKFYSFCLFLFATLLLLYIQQNKLLSKPDLNWLDTITYTYQLGVQKSGGGAIGGLFGYVFMKLVGLYGSIAIITALYIIAVLLFTEKSFVHFIDWIKAVLVSFYATLKSLFERIGKDDEVSEKQPAKPEAAELDIDDKMKDLDKKIKIMDFTKNFDQSFRDKEITKPDLKNVDMTTEKKDKKPKPESEDIKQVESADKETPNIIAVSNQHFTNYKLPSTDLMSLPVENKSSNTKKEVMNNAKILDETLKNFGVGASISQVSVGPTITRYELSLNPGVKVSKIVSLADDISLSLASSGGVRIEAPIPGKAAVGIEVPNKDISSVYLREVIESEEYKSNKSKIAFAIGKDVAGASIVADLSKMPHLLIAGATGSGKSVCINTLITSILYKATPEEVKLLMIDPKVVELSVYKNIPHLLVPVVTDPKKAAGALNWAVTEMTDRYKKFAENNVRDITGYNASNREGITKLPQIVVIIDELADLMMVAPGDVEDCICRLAQMARAAGIHLVVATQRPSVDVITGLIKANIPSRISFAVSSQIDSRTILDMAGAEKLLGKGDMLFFPVGESKPIRIQGAFISEKEVERLVNCIKDQVTVSYNDAIIKELDEVIEIEEDDDVDELLKDAIEMVIDSGQASILMLQRRLKIGYNRAARLVDQMEERRIIGGYEGSKPRRVLISREQFEDMM